jgi:membrane protein
MPQLERTGHDRSTGLKPTLVRTFREFQEDNITDWAAALTYYGLLSLFPALIALVAVVGLFFDPVEVTDALTEIVAQLGPSSAVETFTGPIESITQDKGASGVLLVVGLLGAVWSASGYIGAFMRASNVIYEVDEGRPFWKLRPLQMLVTLLMVILLAAGAMAVVLSGPVAEAVGGAIGLGDAAVTAWQIAKWPVLVAFMAFMVALLYRVSPNARLGGLRAVAPGAALAVIVWIVVSALFAFYVANFGSYNATYGALGGVVVFLMWLWLTNVAILLGAQLNAERERDRQFAEGVEGAERELQVPQRDNHGREGNPRTA